MWKTNLKEIRKQNHYTIKQHIWYWEDYKAKVYNMAENNLTTSKKDECQNLPTELSAIMLPASPKKERSNWKNLL